MYKRQVPGSAGVNARSTRTTFLVKPGALEMAQLSVPMPVEMYRNANTYSGGGSTDIWYRWGYVIHPMGYDWAGNQQGFAEKSSSLDITSTGRADGSGDAYDASATTWSRKFDMLNLGILPIFHA